MTKRIGLLFLAFLVAINIGVWVFAPADLQPTQRWLIVSGALVLFVVGVFLISVLRHGWMHDYGAPPHGSAYWTDGGSRDGGGGGHGGGHGRGGGGGHGGGGW